MKKKIKLETACNKPMRTVAMVVAVLILFSNVVAAVTVREEIVKQARYSLDNNSLNDATKTWAANTKGNWDWYNEYVLSSYKSTFDNLRASYACNPSVWTVDDDACYKKPNLKKNPKAFIAPVSFYSNMTYYGFYGDIGRGGQCKYFANLITNIAKLNVEAKNGKMFHTWKEMTTAVQGTERINYVKPGDVIFDGNIKKVEIQNGDVIDVISGYDLFEVISINEGSSSDGTVASIKAMNNSGNETTISITGEKNTIYHLPSYKVTNYSRGIKYAKPGNIIFQTGLMFDSIDHAAVVYEINSGNFDDGTVTSLDVIDSNFVNHRNNETIGYHNISGLNLLKYYVYTGIDYEATGESTPTPNPTPQPPGQIHNVNKNKDYAKIQDAINDANSEDKINVYSGTYRENVNVTRKLIIEGIDLGSGMPAIDAEKKGSVVRLYAGNVTFRNFTLVNASDWSSGIDVPSSGNQILYNKIKNNSYGINFGYNSRDNIVTKNIISNGTTGIQLGYFTRNNTFQKNDITDNEYSIYLMYTTKNIFDGNYIRSSHYGLYFFYGADYSTDNWIYRNKFIGNTNDTYIPYPYPNTNIWNSTTQIIYDFNGKTYQSYLGNYWDKYAGADSDKDGIGDTPYAISDVSKEKDSYPLVSQNIG